MENIEKQALEYNKIFQLENMEKNILVDSYNHYNQIQSTKTGENEEEETTRQKKVIKVITVNSDDSEPKTNENTKRGVDDTVIFEPISVFTQKNQPGFIFHTPAQNRLNNNTSHLDKNILEYMKRNKKNLLSITDIQRELNIEDNSLFDKTIHKLKKQGDIYEPKSGYVMILK